MQQRGFSLLELSVVLTILAIVVAGGLTLGTAKVQQTEISNTLDEMEEIEKAMSVFVNEYGRLPCPASITLTSSNALYGREATDCADATPPAGLTRVEYPAASGKYVRIGGVPFFSLQMQQRYLGDEWNNRYLYAVSEAFITAATSTSTGHIRVVDNSGTSISDEVAWLVVSPGKTHEGGYATKTGTLTSACDATNKDGENCDADGIFTDGTFNEGTTAANFFDDLIFWETRMQLFEVQAAGAGGGNDMVPTDLILSTATHNGDFNGIAGLQSWLDSNGCSGHDLCTTEDVERYIYANGVPASIANNTVAYVWGGTNCLNWDYSANLFSGNTFLFKNTTYTPVPSYPGTSTCDNARVFACCQW